MWLIILTHLQGGAPLAMADKESCSSLSPPDAGAPGYLLPAVTGYGGYGSKFVDPVPESLSCPVCLLPFRDPHLVGCCGRKYCESCIDRVKTAQQPCPVCKQRFSTLIDRDYQRKVLNLKVFCSRHEHGCQWIGELRHLDHHERDECGWAMVECSYQCGAHLPRRLMDEHELDECSQRPMEVKIKSLMKTMEEKHEREMAVMREEFRKERETREKEVEGLKKELEEIKGY